MKQIEVHIMQQSYLLACPEGAEDRMLAAVQRVDAAMNQIRDAGKVRARERIAVLAALNIAFDLTAAPRATAANAHGEADSSANDASIASGHSPTAQQLLQRLDEALGSDGQLL